MKSIEITVKNYSGNSDVFIYVDNENIGNTSIDTSPDLCDCYDTEQEFEDDVKEKIANMFPEGVRKDTQVTEAVNQAVHTIMIQANPNF